jgi:3-oxoadipate CoA-transferase beta subunit
VMMDLLTKSGEAKLVSECTYPLTGIGCVSRVYSDLAVFDVGPQGARVIEIVEGLSFDQLQDMIKAPLVDARRAA